MRYSPLPRWPFFCGMLLACVTGCHPAPEAASPMFTDVHGLMSVPVGSPLRSHLTIESVGTRDPSATLELPAAIEADPARVSNVLAPLTGRIMELRVHIGDHVHRGEVLAVMASGDFTQAVADDDKARDALDLANRALERARSVQDAGGSALKDLEGAQSAYRQARAEMVRADDRLRSLNGSGKASRRLELVAPQDGVVTNLAVGAGAQIGDPTATLMTITNVDRVYVSANVAEEDIGRTAVGTGVDIALDSNPRRVLHGRVDEIDAVVQPDTRRQKIRVILPNSEGRFLPGMYATVRTRVAGHAGVSVPQSALLMNNDAVSVFVQVHPWVFERRNVEIADETDTGANVVQGLKAGERIVTRGGVLLND